MADNFFTSLTLANALLTRQLTYCGTVRRNRRFLPPALLDTKQRNINSSSFAFLGDKTLVSYIPKRGKNVLLLSTQHHSEEVHDEREDKKPEIILYYNRTKGAVDSVNFVFDFIFVFVIVFVNDKVFSLSLISRFCKYFRFRFVFVLSFLQYRFRFTSSRG